MKKVKLFIAVPSCRDWKVPFGSSFMGVVHHIMHDQLGGRLEGLQLYTMAGASILSRARQIALRKAYEGGFTHLLMLDDDMSFPSDTVHRLVSHNLPFVAANYCRKVPGKPISISFDLEGNSTESAGKSGLEEVQFVGAGLTLIDIEAIKHVPEPHFEVIWDENKQDYWGEDIYFCQKLRVHGVKIHIDHDLSQKVGHIGDYEYRFNVEQMITDVNSRIAEVKRKIA